MRQAALIGVLAVMLVFSCSGCAGYVTTPGGWEVALATGQSKVNVTETPGMQRCRQVESSAMPAGGRVLIYSSKTGQHTLGVPPRIECQTIDAGRRVEVEGGSISQALAWLAALIFTDGLVGAIP